MTDLELRLLLKTLKEHGVQRFRNQEVQLEFAAPVQEQPKAQEPAPAPQKVGAQFGNPTEEELLFMSSTDPLDINAVPEQ